MVKRIFAILIMSLALFGVTLSSANAATNAHWDHNKVYVVDKSSSLWPVGRAAEIVDNNSKLNLVWVTKCPKNAQCIYVKSGSIKDFSTIGVTHEVTSGTKIVSAHITLDNGWSHVLTFHERKAAACHELLHAVGLQYHRHTIHSCLNTYITNAVSAKPDNKDYAALRKMYI